MAKRQPISQRDEWFIGEDKVLEFDIVNDAEVPLNVSAQTIRFVLRRHVNDLNPTLVVDGADVTFGDSDPDDGITGDRVLVRVQDSDTADLLAGTYQYALRRADDGSEQLYAYGPATLQKAADV